MSFSLEFAPLWDGINTLVNGVGPAYLLIGGIAVGLVLVGVMVKALQTMRF